MHSSEEPPLDQTAQSDRMQGLRTRVVPDARPYSLPETPSPGKNRRLLARNVSSSKMGHMVGKEPCSHLPAAGAKRWEKGCLKPTRTPPESVLPEHHIYTPVQYFPVHPVPFLPYANTPLSMVMGYDPLNPANSPFNHTHRQPIHPSTLNRLYSHTHGTL